MPGEKKTMWVNVYEEIRSDDKVIYVTGSAYETKDEALKGKITNPVDTVPITFEI